MIFRQRFRRHGEVSIQDHQYIAGRGGKTLADRIALALAVLFQDFDVPTIPVGIADAFAFLERAVAGIALDEHDLLSRAEFRHAQDGVFDIALLVAAGNENADGKFAVRKLADRTPDDIGP